MRNYKNLGAWQHADDLTVHIYQVTRSFRLRKYMESLPNCVGQHIPYPRISQRVPDASRTLITSGFCQ